MLIITIIMAGFLSGSSSNDLPTVEQVDINKYAGLWYEIARLPNSFEKGLECVTANYSLKTNGKIQVLNKGYSAKKGDYKSSKGTAWRPNEDYPGRLKVSFFWPFSGNYYIIALDKEYSYALVGDPSRKYLWVLARTKELDENIYSDLLAKAQSHGFDTEKMMRIKQDCK